MGWLDRVADRAAGGGQAVSRAGQWPVDLIEQFTYGPGLTYTGFASTSQPSTEAADAGFAWLVNGAFRSNPVVFACELKRLSIFTEARFLYRRLRQGKPGDLFSTADLAILERPWLNATTGDLLARMLLDADFAGNSFTARWSEQPDRLRQLRPDWVTIVMGSPDDPQLPSSDLRSELLGYIYNPQDGSSDPEVLLPDEVAHFAPIPDPLARFRGMSWLTPVIADMQGDTAATAHKLQFFNNGATPQLVVKWPDKGAGGSVNETSFQKFVSTMDQSHKGWRNAYKTLYLGGGADVSVVGRDLAQLDFSKTQGKGETRIAAAAGMHPVIVGLSEGLAGSSLNAGNFNSARRSVADTTMRWLWRCAASSLATITGQPADAELWVYDRDIAFLREDRKDAAEIQQIKAQTIRQLVDGGFTPSSATTAVEAEDMSLLVHTGLLSVQLQEPGAAQPKQPGPTANGSNNGQMPAITGAGR